MVKNVQITVCVDEEHFRYAKELWEEKSYNNAMDAIIAGMTSAPVMTTNKND